MGDFVSLPPDLFRAILQDASYEGVVFPVTMLEIDGGHDSVAHTAYRRRGADVEWTGMKAYSGTLSIPLFNGLQGFGNLFPDTYYDLIRAFEDKPIGTLHHPIQGTFQVHIAAWKQTFDPGVRNGALITAQWIEHNATAGVLLADSSTLPTDAPSTAIQQATAADTAMATAAPTASYTPVSPVFVAQLTFLDGTPQPYGAIVGAVAAMRAAVEANLALPVFAAATALPAAWPAVAALEALRATTYALGRRYLGTVAQPRTYTTRTTISAWQVAQLVYGDASLAGLITAANPIEDPMFIPAGTTLVILPAV